MFRVIVLSIMLAACSSNIIPETSNQVQVVSYSQLAQVTSEVSEACRSEVLTKDVCKDLLVKIKKAYVIIDTDVAAAADLVDSIRSKL